MNEKYLTTVKLSLNEERQTGHETRIHKLALTSHAHANKHKKVSMHTNIKAHRQTRARKLCIKQHA